MRRLVVDASLEPAALEAALVSPAPLLLELVASPSGIERLPFLRALALFDGTLVARFSGLLTTPLVEAALLARFAEWEPGAALDLAGALLSPLFVRLGRQRAVSLLLVHGSLVDPGLVLLPRVPGDRSSSPLALAVARDLLAPPARGRRAPLARERAAFGWLLTAGEKAEGLAAFRQRRPPAFGW